MVEEGLLLNEAVQAPNNPHMFLKKVRGAS